MIASEFLRDKIWETSGTMSVRSFQILVLTRIVLDQRSTLWRCPYPMCALIRNEFLRDKIRKTSGTMSMHLVQISMFTMDIIGPTLNAMCALIRNEFLRDKIWKTSGTIVHLAQRRRVRWLILDECIPIIISNSLSLTHVYIYGHLRCRSDR